MCVHNVAEWNRFVSEVEGRYLKPVQRRVLEALCGKDGQERMKTDEELKKKVDNAVNAAFREFRELWNQHPDEARKCCDAVGKLAQKKRMVPPPTKFDSYAEFREWHGKDHPAVWLIDRSYYTAAWEMFKEYVKKIAANPIKKSCDKVYYVPLSCQDVEDVVSETFRALGMFLGNKGHESFDNANGLKNYLHKTCVSRSIDVLRKKKIKIEKLECERFDDEKGGQPDAPCADTLLIERQPTKTIFKSDLVTLTVDFTLPKFKNRRFPDVAENILLGKEELLRMLGPTVEETFGDNEKKKLVEILGNPVSNPGFEIRFEYEEIMRLSQMAVVALLKYYYDYPVTNTGSKHSDGRNGSTISEITGILLKEVRKIERQLSERAGRKK